MGYGVLAFMTLEIAQGQEASAIEVLGTIPEVLEVHKVTGPGDLLCRVVAREQRAPPRRHRAGAGGARCGPHHHHARPHSPRRAMTPTAAAAAALPTS